MAAFTVEGVIDLLTDGYDRGLQEAENHARATAGNIDKLLGKVKTALTVAGFVQLGKSIYNLAKQTATFGDTIDKSSQKLGISRKAFQEWRYVLGQNGISIDNLGRSMRTMTNAVEKGGKAFADMGLDVKKLQKMKPEQMFGEIVRSLSKMTDINKRNSLAQQVFGQSYMELLPLLNAGVDSIDELTRKAHELGIVMDDETIDAAVNFGDNLDNLTQSFQAFTMSFAAPLLKPITSFFQSLTGIVSRLTPLIRDAFNGGSWHDVIMEIADIFGMDNQTFLRIEETLTEAFAPAINIFNVLVETAGSIFDTIWSMMKGDTTAQEGILSIFTDVLGAGDTIMHNIVDSAADAFANLLDWLTSAEGVQSVKNVLAGIYDAGAYLMSSLTGIFEKLADKLEKEGKDEHNPVKMALASVFNIVDAIGDSLSNFWQTIAGVLRGDTNGIHILQSVFDGIFGENGIIGSVLSGFFDTLKSAIDALLDFLGLRDSVTAGQIGYVKDAISGEKPTQAGMAGKYASLTEDQQTEVWWQLKNGKIDYGKLIGAGIGEDIALQLVDDMTAALSDETFDLSVDLDQGWFKPVQEKIAGHAFSTYLKLVPTLGDALNGLVGHATGKDYVPFDNYVARLHRGEAVLSAFEAAQWRDRGQLGAGGTGNTYNDSSTLYVGQMYMGNELDAAQLQQTLATMTARRNRGYGY